MLRVYKYPLPIARLDRFELELPVGAELLHVDVQGAVPQLWALVDPNAETQRRTFILRGTGHEITDTIIRHIGTFLVSGGALVFHLFEILEVKPS